MATNRFGFIQKKYRQPNYERELFCNACAYYIAGNGKRFIVEACPHFLSGEKWGARIDHYEIQRHDEDGRRTLAYDIKSQKRAMEIIERLLAKNAA